MTTRVVKSIQMAVKYWEAVSEKPTMRFVKAGARLLKTGLVTFCVMETATSLYGYPAFITGKSMQPEFNSPTHGMPRESWLSSWMSSFVRFDLDWIWVSRWKARHYTFARGDIVVFISPKDPSEYVIKRVIGLEGDIVTMHCQQPIRVTVPQGHCWVEGDNWSNSVDSTKYGPISKGLIFGVATHVIWPAHKWRKLGEGIPDSLQPDRVEVASYNQTQSLQYRPWMRSMRVFLHFLTD